MIPGGAHLRGSKVLGDSCYDRTVRVAGVPSTSQPVSPFCPVSTATRSTLLASTLSEGMKGHTTMTTRLRDEIQHGPVYAEGSGAPLSVLITGAMLAMLGLILRLLSRAN